MTTVIDPPVQRPGTDRWVKALEWPMALLALLVIPALLLDDGDATPRVHLIATSINWFVWLAFCAEFALRLVVAPNRSTFIRQSWLDLFIIAISPPFGVPEALQSLRAIRALRILRMLRLVRTVGVLTIGLRASRRVLRRHQFQYVLVATGAVMLLGSAGLYVVERDQNEAITSFGDALWWAVTTTTTVGYGDIYPKTGEGRLIAVFLMLTGIGVIGIFTATIASLFMAQDEETEFERVQRRLDVIENQLNRLLEREQR